MNDELFAIASHVAPDIKGYGGITPEDNERQHRSHLKELELLTIGQYFLECFNDTVMAAGVQSRMFQSASYPPTNIIMHYQ